MRGIRHKTRLLSVGLPHPVKQMIECIFNALKLLIVRVDSGVKGRCVDILYRSLKAFKIVLVISHVRQLFRLFRHLPDWQELVIYIIFHIRRHYKHRKKLRHQNRRTNNNYNTRLIAAYTERLCISVLIRHIILKKIASCIPFHDALRSYFKYPECRLFSYKKSKHNRHNADKHIHFQDVPHKSADK